MKKSSATLTKIRAHVFLVTAFMVGVMAGASNLVFALSMPGPTWDGAQVRDYLNGAADPSSLNVGQNTPSNPPNGAAKPVPTFSAVDTPVITSSTGPVQIADDLLVHGVIDAANGLISKNGPVKFFDDVSIEGPIGTGLNIESGKITSGNGVLQVPSVVVGLNGTISGEGNTLNVSSNLQIPTSNLQVLGDTNLNTLTVNGMSRLKGNVVANGSVVAGTQLSVASGGKIGAYYRLELDADIQANSNGDIAIHCGVGDILISCVGNVANPYRLFYLGSRFDAVGENCHSSFNNPDPMPYLAHAQAVCFNPDLTPAVGYTPNAQVINY